MANEKREFDEEKLKFLIHQYAKHFESDDRFDDRNRIFDAIDSAVRKGQVEALEKIARSAPRIEGHMSFNTPGQICDQRIASEALTLLRP